MRMRKRKRPKIQWKKALDFPKCDFISNRLHFSVIEMGFWSLYVAFNYRIDCNNLRIRMAIQTYVYKRTRSRMSQSRVAHYSVIAFSDKIVYFQRFFCILLAAQHLSQNFISGFYIFGGGFLLCSLIRKAQTDSVTVAIMKRDIAICSTHSEEISLHSLVVQVQQWERDRDKPTGLQNIPTNSEKAYNWMRAKHIQRVKSRSAEKKSHPKCSR